MKLVKQQINGNERTVVKDKATAEDLRLEAERLQTKYGYVVQPDGRPGAYVATHRFFGGKYVLSLEKE